MSHPGATYTHENYVAACDQETHMKPIATVVLLACASSAFCQEVQVVPFTGNDGTVSRLNQSALTGRAAAKGQKQKNSIVFAGDSVIPHVVDGASWRTSMMFVNLEDRTVHFKVLFLQDNGDDLNLPIPGQGSVYGESITLPPAASIQFETAGTGSKLASGWAYMLQDDYNDSIGGMTVFRQSVPGRPDFEAVVPIVNQ